MLISCPSCNTKFAVPIRAIGTAGRKVKCTKCQHIWFQEPVSAKLDNLLRVEYSPAHGIPARRKTKFKMAYVVSIAILLFFSASIEFFKHAEKYPAIAKVVGVTNYDGLRFHDVRIQSNLSDSKLSYQVTGTVVNLTDHKIKLPLINVKIYSKGGRIMGKSQLAMIEPFIEPFQQIEIKPEISGVSGNADKAELSFENWVESALR